MARQQTTQPTQQQKTNSAIQAQPATKPANRPSHEQIAKRAFELFLARGGQHGRHVDDWVQAERELTTGKQ